MRQFDMSANLMSLGGLAIAIGMLVDAAVVVVENVVAQLAVAGASRLPRLHIIYRAVREVSLPVTSGILIIVIVFLPLLTFGFGRVVGQPDFGIVGSVEAVPVQESAAAIHEWSSTRRG